MDVLFLSSVQGYNSRVGELAARLRAARSDLTVKVLSPEETQGQLAKWKLKFGPAVVVDGRLEFVGIPRLRTLVERIDIAIDRKLHPPPPEPPAAAPAAPATPAAPPPAKPATPPASPPPPPPAETSALPFREQ